MKLTNSMAIEAFGIALGGAYDEAPAVDAAIERAYDAFRTSLSASGITPGASTLRAAASAACVVAGADAGPDARAALSIAQSFYSHLIDRPAAAGSLLTGPSTVLAALAADWPAGLDRDHVAERISFACPEAAQALLAD